jgi:hypothetical protein
MTGEFGAVTRICERALLLPPRSVPALAASARSSVAVPLASRFSTSRAGEPVSVAAVLSEGKRDRLSVANRKSRRRSVSH